MHYGYGQFYISIYYFLVLVFQWVVPLTTYRVPVEQNCVSKASFTFCLTLKFITLLTLAIL